MSYSYLPEEEEEEDRDYDRDDENKYKDPEDPNFPGEDEELEYIAPPELAIPTIIRIFDVIGCGSDAIIIIGTQKEEGKEEINIIAKVDFWTLSTGGFYSFKYIDYITSLNDFAPSIDIESSSLESFDVSSSSSNIAIRTESEMIYFSHSWLNGFKEIARVGGEALTYPFAYTDTTHWTSQSGIDEERYMKPSPNAFIGDVAQTLIGSAKGSGPHPPDNPAVNDLADLPIMTRNVTDPASIESWGKENFYAVTPEVRYPRATQLIRFHIPYTGYTPSDPITPEIEEGVPGLVPTYIPVGNYSIAKEITTLADVKIRGNNHFSVNICSESSSSPTTIHPLPSSIGSEIFLNIRPQNIFGEGYFCRVPSDYIDEDDPNTMPQDEGFWKETVTVSPIPDIDILWDVYDKDIIKYSRSFISAPANAGSGGGSPHQQPRVFIKVPFKDGGIKVQTSNEWVSMGVVAISANTFYYVDNLPEFNSIPGAVISGRCIIPVTPEDTDFNGNYFLLNQEYIIKDHSKPTTKIIMCEG